ncbi:hypothetical protein HC928_12385 [bacterium]|nr:hypothetical protein [bacterium]
MHFPSRYAVITIRSLLLAIVLNPSVQAAQLTGQTTVLIESYIGQINSIDLPLPEVGLTPTGTISFNLNSDSQATTPY